MGFLKQLLTPFIEFDEDKKKDANIKKVDDQIIPPAAPIVQPKAPVSDEPAHHPLITDEKLQTPNPPTFAIPAIPSSLPMEEHVRYFESMIDKANTENPMFTGADYKEFVDAKMDIDDIADENIKYTTAFNILKGSGLTKEKLIATAHEYMQLIGRDLNAFQAAHSQKYKKQLQQKESDLKNKVEELQRLAQRTQTLKTEINQLTKEINTAQGSLNTTKNSFLLAGEKKQQDIQDELNKIVKYFD